MDRPRQVPGRGQAPPLHYLLRFVMPTYGVFEKSMNLMIKDDGLGFDPGAIAPQHLGIAIMRERANSIGANLSIESRVGQGTTVELDWRSARED